MSKAYRGVDKFFVAKIISDTPTGIEYDTPYQLPAVQHVTRENAEESAKYYGDNKSQIVVKGEGTNTVTFTTFCLDPIDLAKLLGKRVIGKAMVSTNNSEDVNFGIMYRLKNTDGTYEYVALAKCKFLAPSEDVETQNDSTDVSFMELQAEMQYTIAEFEQEDGTKEAFNFLKLKQEIGENYETSFFAEMPTPDTLKELQGITD